MASGRLTLNQVVTVTTIRNYMHVHGHAPTLRELAALLHRSRGTTQGRIRSLIKKGVIRRPPHTHRTLEILPQKVTSKTPAVPIEDEDLVVT